jgi:hypothetical protein
MLIGAAVASDDVLGTAHRPADLIEPLIPDLQKLVGENGTHRTLTEPIAPA